MKLIVTCIYVNLILLKINCLTDTSIFIVEYVIYCSLNENYNTTLKIPAW